MRAPVIRKSLPVLGLFGHHVTERHGEAAEKYGRFTGEHEVYLGPLTVYWSAPFERGMETRRQVIVTVSSLHLPFMPYVYAKVDTLVKASLER